MERVCCDVFVGRVGRTPSRATPLDDALESRKYRANGRLDGIILVGKRPNWQKVKQLIGWLWQRND